MFRLKYPDIALIYGCNDALIRDIEYTLIREFFK